MNISPRTWWNPLLTWINPTPDTLVPVLVAAEFVPGMGQDASPHLRPPTLGPNERERGRDSEQVMVLKQCSVQLEKGAHAPEGRC